MGIRSLFLFLFVRDESSICIKNLLVLSFCKSTLSFFFFSLYVFFFLIFFSFSPKRATEAKAACLFSVPRTFALAMAYAPSLRLPYFRPRRYRISTLLLFFFLSPTLLQPPPRFFRTIKTIASIFFFFFFSLVLRYNVNEYSATFFYSAFVDAGTDTSAGEGGRQRLWVKVIK